MTPRPDERAVAPRKRPFLGGRPEDHPLRRDEERAIAALQRLAERWPKSLWLFSASGDLTVMRCDDQGERPHVRGGGVDQDYIVDTIYGIANDGGDW